MAISVYPSMYFPPISVVAHMLKNEAAICIHDTEFFVKQTYRNRCYILSSQGVQTLVVPVKHHSKEISKVEIDNAQRWASIHWRSLITCYQKSPYFQYYSSYFKEIYDHPPSLLWELNLQLLTLCLKLLKKETISLTPFSFFNMQENQVSKSLVTADLPKRGVSVYKDSNLPTYAQVFGTAFVYDLSIIDLLCNEGPYASQYLENWKC